MSPIDAFCLVVILLGVGSLAFGAWSAWHGAYSFAPRHPDEPTLAGDGTTLANAGGEPTPAEAVATEDGGTFTTREGRVRDEPPRR